MAFFSQLLVPLQRSSGTAGVLIYVIFLGSPIAPSYALYFLSAVAFVSLIFAPESSASKGFSINYALVAFLVTTLLSILFSTDHSRSIIISSSFFPAGLVFYLIVHQFKLRHLTPLYIVFCLTSVIINALLLAAFWQSSSDDPVRWMREASLTFLSVPNDLVFVSLIAPFTLSIIFICHSRVLKICSVFALVLSLNVILLFRSNAALLVMLGSMTFMVWFIWQTRRHIFLLLCILSILIVDALQGFVLIDKFMHAEVWGNRLPLWYAAFQMFLDAPMLGNGPGAFSLLSEKYINELVLPAWLKHDPRHAPWAHNLYLEVLAERGMLGLLALLALVGVVGYYLKELYVAISDVRIYALAMLASLMGIVMAGIFELSLLRHWVVMMLAIICASTIVLLEYQSGSEGV